EEDDRKHEKADRLFRDGTREQEETPEDRDEEARGESAEAAARHLHAQEVRRENREARDQRHEQLHLREGREPSHRGSRGPQEGESGQLLVVTVHANRIDAPRAFRDDVVRDPGEREPVDAERERAERERDQSRAEGDAHECREDRGVDFQPRRNASKDCGGSTAGASRIEPEGRARSAARRSPRPDSGGIATIAMTINAKVTGSNVRRTAWPKTTSPPFGCSCVTPRTPSAV